jgi:hypothetical protein
MSVTEPYVFPVLHCKISYFEQPNLIMPKNQKSEQDGEHLFAQSISWLPDEQQDGQCMERLEMD